MAKHMKMISVDKLKDQSAALLIAIRKAEASGNMALVRELLQEKYDIDKCVYDIGRAKSIRVEQSAGKER